MKMKKAKKKEQKEGGYAKDAKTSVPVGGHKGEKKGAMGR
jgi:hypothetical protein